MAIRFYIENEDEDLVDDQPSFDEAIDVVAQALTRGTARGGIRTADAAKILVGDDDGPHEVAAHVERADVAENEDAFAADAELVVTIDSASFVPPEWRELAREGHVADLAHGPIRAHTRDVSIVYVQFSPEVSDAERRFAELEFNPRRKLTKKGEQLYRAVGMAERIAADARRRGASETAARAVVRAAQRGVPGLVRKNPSELERGTEVELEHTSDRTVARRIAMDHLAEDPHYYSKLARCFAENPSIVQEDADAAVDKFKEFHRFDPRRLEELGALKIPTRVRKMGAAKYVLYRSDKVDPSTLRKPSRPVDYIHEHDAGVCVYATDGTPDTEVPRHIREATAIVKLGKCLGFALRDGHEAEGTNPLPDLACTPDGKCLLVVQDKKKVLAMFWGGALGVFARGIDG